MYREFVINWIDAYKRSLGVEWVAEKCGIKSASASAKAHQLRSKGVNLPPMRRARKNGLDVDSLNHLIESKI